MMERLRNRDLRTNNNKCYTMYFDDDQNKDITNSSKTSASSTSMPLKKIKAKSPRKREPVKSVAKPASATLSDDSNPATAVTDNASASDSGVLDFTVAKCAAKSADDDDDNNKCDDVSSAVADKHPIDAHQGVETTTELCSETMTPAPTRAQNERKRRLSVCRDDDDDDERDDGDEDGGDAGIEVGTNDANCGTFASSSSTNGDGSNKKLKMEFSREQMFQVRAMKMQTTIKIELRVAFATSGRSLV